MSNESGDLLVGTDGKGMVVINLPYDMTGHIIFDPGQARQLAMLLEQKALAAEIEIARLGGVRNPILVVAT